jgi:hypothetical protein
VIAVHRRIVAAWYNEMPQFAEFCMKLLTWTILAVVPFALIACGPDKPADTSTAPPTQELQSPQLVQNLGNYSGAAPARSPSRVDLSANPIPPNSSVANGSGPIGSPSQVVAPVIKSDMPAPPDGANYTLQCMTFTGPSHTVDSMRAKAMMIQRTNSRDWYIVHEEDQSTLYYGFYKTFDDRTQTVEYTRAQKDRTKIATMVDSNGERYFPQATFSPILLPDPVAPAEWDILNSPGSWTLQILVYRDNPQRKQAAVDMVREFRKNNVNAYFHHFHAVSEVYIGSWNKDAIKENLGEAAQSNDPNQTMIIFAQPFNGMASMHAQTPNGRDVKIVAPKIEILDPTLKAALDRYPILYINGISVGRPQRMHDGTVKVVPFPSCLVQIPRPGDATDTATVESGPGGNAGAAAPSATPGLGGLR